MPVIAVDHLYKRYHDHMAVQDVSFTVEEGEIFGVVGPNGSGKTTTVECIEGLRKPDRGTVRVLGLDPQRDHRELHQHVGVQLQESALPEKIKVWEALDLYSSFYRTPADWSQLLDELGLTDKRNTAFRNLSGGQKQRLSIALALVGTPKIAVLDELTTGLDPQARRDTWQLIEQVRDRGVTILLVTHFMEEAERLCDRVAVIHAGHITAIDSPANLTARVGGEQRIRFHPSRALDTQVLERLTEVRSVSRNGSQVVVTGVGNLLNVVTSVLAREGIIAEHLRVEQVSLEDAVVALTVHDRNTRGTDAPLSG